MNTLAVPRYKLAIPQAEDIDYSDVEEICAYQLLLTKMFEREGGFAYPAVANAATREIARQGRVWLKEVAALIQRILSGAPAPSGLSLGSIPALIDSYDIFHRITYGKPCYRYLREVKLKTADRWLGGDKTISRTDVVLMLLSEADRDISTLDERFYKYAISVMGEWIEELIANGRFVDVQMPECYKRLAYLLRQDLFVYLNSKEQAKAKAQWIEEYTLSEARLGELDTRDLRSYLNFARAASAFHSPIFEDYIERHHALLATLSSRPDLHPYHRQTLDLTLATCHPA